MTQVPDPSTHMTPHSHLYPVLGALKTLLASSGTCIHVVHVDSGTQIHI